MSLEYRPVGVGCNLGCDYCYETSTRDQGHIIRHDKNKVWSALSSTETYWSLFGGEAMLIPFEELEELLALAFSKFKRSGIQTNGTLIQDRHIDLFVKYNTNVGLSIDGPGELNDSRAVPGNIEATRRMTERSHWALHALAKRAKDVNIPGLMPSLIVTLHSGNIGAQYQERFIEWLWELDGLGISWMNLHVMEMDARASKWALPIEESIKFMLRLWDIAPTFKNLRFSTFDEIMSLLKGRDQEVGCIWHACDPWNTAAVQGLEGDGSPSHCTRTNKDGKAWLPASGSGKPTQHAIGNFPGNRFHERQLSLYVTPQEHGGCKDCRFWSMCKGQCPGCGEASVTEAHGDWRYRTTYCTLYKALFTEGETRLIAVGDTPVSKHPKREQIEHAMYQLWAQGQDAPLNQILDVANGVRNRSKSFVNGHGDQAHGDEHGDHTDVSENTK